jgi:branched-subunit amino acid ABC-type transport system permease component
VIDLALLALAGALALARLALGRRYRAMQQQGIKATDVGHAALGILAAQACLHSQLGAVASALITALYVIYQTWEDRSPKDVATYLAAFALAVAAKLGVPLVVH